MMLEHYWQQAQQLVSVVQQEGRCGKTGSGGRGGVGSRDGRKGFDVGFENVRDQFFFQSSPNILKRVGGTLVFMTHELRE